MIAPRSPRVERIECASPTCSAHFERPVGVRGRPRRYCSNLCGNFARLMVKAEALRLFPPFRAAPSPQRPGEPPPLIHFAALKGRDGE